MTQIQMPRPWGQDAEVNAYHNAIAQAEAAEAAGFGHFWITEQHFFTELGPGACPDTLPRPIQRPHPPLWAAASNLASYERVGRQGLGVIGVTRNSISETRAAIRSYRQAIRATDPKEFVGACANEQVAGFALAYCDP